MLPFAGSDIETLCIAAEIAAVMLLFSVAWRPRVVPDADTGHSPIEWDWGPHQEAYAQALVAVGRSLGLRCNDQDQQRLQQLQQQVPQPWRDRLTGMLNAGCMDRVIGLWGASDGAVAYPSCYALVTLKSHEALMDQHGAMITELAVLRVGDYLSETLTDCAVVSRYQPYRFLLLHFSCDRFQCREAMSGLLDALHADDFFQARGAAIPIECEFQLWQSTAPVDPETLLQLLEDSEGMTPAESLVSSPTPALMVAESTTGKRVEASVQPLAPPPDNGSLFPNGSPWDAPSEETLEEKERVDTGTVPAEVQGGLEGYATEEDIQNLLNQLKPVMESRSIEPRKAPAETPPTPAIHGDLVSVFPSARSSGGGHREYVRQTATEDMPG
jgi:GGDEF domain-containing protein